MCDYLKMLKVTGISKSYRGARAKAVLASLDFALANGEYVAIMGESGVGKSTLLNLVAGLDQPDSGTILFDGHNLGTLGDEQATLIRRRFMGFVFQAFHVLPHMTAAQNVALPLYLNRVPKSEITDRVHEMLRSVGLRDVGDSLPHELSGGELQRVAIARALVHKPRLLLADEPTGNLDPGTAHEIMGLLRERLRATGAAGILVTHSALAARTADRTLLLTSDGLAPCSIQVNPE